MLDYSKYNDKSMKIWRITAYTAKEGFQKVMYFLSLIRLRTLHDIFLNCKKCLSIIFPEECVQDWLQKSLTVKDSRKGDMVAAI